MTFCFFISADDEKLAIWEKPLSGDIFAPYDDPLANMDKVKFHSDLQYLASQAVSSNITINHTSLAGVTGTGYQAGNGGGPASGSSAPISDGQIRVSSIELSTHGLGYVPLCYVLYNNRIVSPGTVVQTDSDMIRMVSVYVTTTKVFLREIAISSAVALPAISRDYSVLVFREPIADPLQPTLFLSRDNPMVLAKGKITEDNRPLRASVASDARFYVPIERTIDIKNGAIRNISPLDGIIDYGSYNGNFSTARSVLVTY